MVAPLVHPFSLNLLQVAFVGLLAGAVEVGQHQYPIQQLGEANAVDFGLGEVVAKLFVERDGNVLMVGPFDRRLVVVHFLMVND